MEWNGGKVKDMSKMIWIACKGAFVYSLVYLGLVGILTVMTGPLATWELIISGFIAILFSFVVNFGDKSA